MWNFAELNSWQVQATPKHDEFFSTDNRSIAHSLVREATQNSGDAALAGGAVELRLRFVELDGQVFRDRYLVGLRDHLAAVAEKAPRLKATMAALDAPSVRILLVEDFGTTGLTGPYEDVSAGGNFNGFWRRFGQSDKADAKGGRHGVGKSTVSSASGIRTVFGLTVRCDDDKRLLYGQAALQPHQLPNGKPIYDSYGLYAATQPPSDPLPFEGQAADQFAQDFSLARQDRSGLSLAIPVPVDELTADALVVAAVQHCFHQILDGSLVVVVDDARIDATTIVSIAENHPELRTLQEALALSREAIDNLTPLVDTRSDRHERLDDSEFDPETLQTMRQRWLEGKTVGVRMLVPAIRPRTQKESVTGEAVLYMRKVEDPAKATETYIRGRLLVPEREVTGRDCLCLMIAKDGPLNTMLGDSEQPSHTKWVQSKLREHYFAPELPFKRARQSLGDLERLLVGAKEGEALPDLLKPYFFTPSFGKPEKAPGEQSPDIPPASPPFMTVRAIEGGFVAEHKASEAGTLAAVRIAVRYLTRNGRPKFDPADFDLGSQVIKKEAEGEAAMEFDTDDGCFVLREVKPGFRLRVTGFDPNRDLYLRASSAEVEAVPEESDA